MKTTLHKRKAGFTVAELLVAIGVFGVAVSIAVGAYVGAIRTQRAANYLMSVNSGVSIVIEQMMREIRTSHSVAVNASAPCSNPGQYKELEAVNTSRGNKVMYRWNEVSQSIERKECNGVDCSASSFETLTTPDTSVKKLCFLIQNQTRAPRVSLVLTVAPSKQNLNDNEVKLQTTISPRVLPMDL